MKCLWLRGRDLGLILNNKRNNKNTEEGIVVRGTLHLLLLGNTRNIDICSFKVCILSSWLRKSGSKVERCEVKKFKGNGVLECAGRK